MLVSIPTVEIFNQLWIIWEHNSYGLISRPSPKNIANVIEHPFGRR